jgi:DNA invertase Pin-like site-specific DNA recombinase
MIEQKVNFDLPLRYVDYLRMSTDNQNPRSPDQQRDEIGREVQRQRRPWIFVRDFTDHGISGRLLKKRPALQELLRQIRSGQLKIDLILVDTFERWGRNDEMEILRSRLWQQHGVLLLTADSHFADPLCDMGKALTMLEQYRANSAGKLKSHDVLRGQIDNCQIKRWPGGGTPRGYRLKVHVKETGHQDYSTLEKDPVTNPVMRYIFERAHALGVGVTTMARTLNADPKIPACFGKIFPDTLAYWLSNPIYYGEMLWGEYCTDIIDDKRVLQKNPTDKQVRVPDFCEPTVSRELWDAVQVPIQMRSNAVRAARASRAAAAAGVMSGTVGNAKQLKALVPGLSLKYPLSGLVRCGQCGGSMRPSGSGGASKDGTRYVYYSCWRRHCGACTNRMSVREAHLWKGVVSALRARLFPSSPASLSGGRGGRDGVPEWLPPLMDEVRKALDALVEHDPQRQQVLEAELGGIRQKLAAWQQSLGKADLDFRLREALETHCGESYARVAELERELEQLGAAARNSKQLFDQQPVLESLARLGELLRGGNVTRTHLELSRHVQRIDVFADGRIAMRTCRLGAMEGVVAMLRNAANVPATAEVAPGTGTDSAVQQVKARRRGRLRTEGTHDGSLCDNGTDADPSTAAQDPDRFAGLDSRWISVDLIEVPPQGCWAAENAEAVRAHRQQYPHLTQQQLAEHFKVSRPTIRQALKRADKNGMGHP